MKRAITTTLTAGAVAAALLLTGTGYAAAQDERTLVVLGDSYSSGEGLYPYEVGTDRPGNTCHRSDRSYGDVAAAERGFRLVNRACSGARIDQLTAANATATNEPAQVTALEGLRPDDAVALTIGGNDLDWSDLVTKCLRYQVAGSTVWASDPDGCQQRKNDGDALVREVAGRLDGVYRDVLDRTPAEVYILLYPPMVPVRAADATKDCVLQKIDPAGTQHLSLSADTSRRMVDLQLAFNDAIRSTVASIQQAHPDGARLHLVDVENAFGGFEGHTISCGFKNRPEPWINTVRVDIWQQPIQLSKRLIEEQYLYGTRTLHPTEKGQQVMGETLAAAIGSA